MSAPPSSQAPLGLIARPGSPLRGRLRVPGDKSISHRAIIFGLLTAGETKVSGLLESEDVMATIEVARALGALIEKGADDIWRIHGRGVGALAQPANVLDFGNSGTSCRLYCGVLATHPIAAHLTGDASLSKRPMERALAPLRQMGMDAETRDGRLPIFIRGAEAPLPISYRLPVASAQVKSAVLLAGLNTPGTTTVIEPVQTRDHTERMLTAFGASISIEPSEDGGRIIRLEGQPELKPSDIQVPADPSSAAFPAVSALLVPGSEIAVEDVLLNPLRAGLYDTLLEMGADIQFEDDQEIGGERIATLKVKHSALKGVTVPAERAPSMIDEYPILAIAAAFAQGTTRMEGLHELRVKESDRLAAMVDGLAKIGVVTRSGEDWLEVVGLGPGGPAGGGPITTHLDHRIAMAFLTAGLAAQGQVSVDDGSMIATSFPDYLDLMQGLGAKIDLANH